MKNKQSYKAASTVNLSEGYATPADKEIEEAVLGALISVPEMYLTVYNKIHADLFYSAHTRTLFKIIQEMNDLEKEIDLMTIVNAARNKNVLEDIGGVSFIAKISGNASHITPIEEYCDILSVMYSRREVIKIGYDAVKKGHDLSSSIEETIENIETSMYSMKSSDREDTKTSADIIYETKKEIEKAYLLRQKGELRGIATGFDQLDRATGGFQAPDLIILAGRPAMGKTAFVISTARFMAYKMNKKIDFYSLEMSDVQLMTRIISAETDINAFDLKNGNIRESDFGVINAKIGRINNNLFIDDTPGLSIQALKAKARKRKKENGTDLIIIDYLQLMSAGNLKTNSREQEISYISRELKILAKSLNIPVIALSQLSRGVDARADKRPLMSDLRESGAIEQDADLIGFLFRPEYYGIFQDEHGNNLQGKAQLLIRKNRNGPLEDIFMDFVKEKAAFINQGDIDPSQPF